MTTKYINLRITEKQYNELMRSLENIFRFQGCSVTISKRRVSKLKKHFDILEKAKKHNKEVFEKYSLMFVNDK